MEGERRCRVTRRESGEAAVEWLAGERDDALLGPRDAAPAGLDGRAVDAQVAAMATIAAWRARGWSLVASAPGPNFPLEFARP
jgi:hypothetical protein